MGASPASHLEVAEDAQHARRIEWRCPLPAAAAAAAAETAAPEEICNLVPVAGGSALQVEDKNLTPK